MSVFTWERRVEFCETDAAGIAHFSSLIIYMEQAEHALLRSIGYSVASKLTSRPQQSNEVLITWPRVHVECDFHSAVRFEDILTVHVGVSKLGSKSITYQHRLQIEDRLVATGTMTSVCCSLHDHGIVSQSIPEDLRTALSRFVAPAVSDHR
jgi:4-hydroxybenzoyl-CoA thioesterase/acyl-CoA thioester hydrolase